MKSAVVSGYSALEYIVGLAGQFEDDSTTLIRHRNSSGWPRLGGSPFYVVEQIARQGHSCGAVTWVGDDVDGRQYVQRAVDSGYPKDGISIISTGVTPVCIMIYQEDGSCGALFDPGFMGKETLVDAQRRLLSGADLVCITVGPPEINLQIVNSCSDDTTIAWVVKDHAESFPDALAHELGRRAKYIFSNRSERDFLNRILSQPLREDQVHIETNGDNSVQLTTNGSVVSRPVRALQAHDVAGAGDTLAGGFLGSVLSDDKDLTMAMDKGIAAAYALLSSRSASEEKHNV